MTPTWQFATLPGVIPYAVYDALVHALGEVGFAVPRVEQRRATTVSAVDYGAAWDVALAAGLGVPQVLGMASRFLVGSLAPWDLLGVSQPTVGQALTQIAATWPQFAGPGEIVTLRSTEGRLQVRWRGRRTGRADRFDALFTVAVVFDRLRAAARRPITASRVLLTLPLAARDRALCTSFFGGIVTAAARVDGLDLSGEDAATTLRTASPLLRRQLRDAASATSLVERVRDAAASCLDLGAPLHEVAARLELHPRTLQRRLERDGVRYRALVEELRVTEARTLLAQPGRRLEDIARELGFAEVATFHRAFRRWTGHAPGRFRREVAEARSRPPKGRGESSRGR